MSGWRVVDDWPFVGCWKAAGGKQRCEFQHAGEAGVVRVRVRAIGGLSGFESVQSGRRISE